MLHRRSLLTGLTASAAFAASNHFRQIDGVWRDHERWAITREEWDAR